MLWIILIAVAAFIAVLLLRAAAFKPQAEEAVDAAPETLDEQKAIDHL